MTALVFNELRTLSDIYDGAQIIDYYTSHRFQGVLKEINDIKRSKYISNS